MRVTKLISALAVVLLLCPFVVANAETFQFSIPDNIVASPGQIDLEVPVYLDQSADAYYFRVEIQYDASKLTFKSVSNGRFGIGNAHTNFCGAGYLHVFSSWSCEVPGSEPAFYVYFDVDGGINQETTIPLTFYDPFCYGLQAVLNGCAPEYPAYSPTYDNGSVYIPPPPEFQVSIADNIPGYPGQTDLEIPVYLDQGAGVSYFRVEIQYDASKLAFSHAGGGRFGVINAHTDFCGPGYLHVFLGTGGPDCIDPGSEPAFYVYFDVDGGINQETTIPLTFHDPFCYSLQAVVNGCPPDYPAYSPTYDNGSVYIPPPPEFEASIAENIPGYPGQPDLEIPVYLDQGAGVSYFRVEIQYDASKLEFSHAGGGRFGIINAHTDFCGPGYLHVFLGTGGPDCIDPGSEPAFYVYFDVDPNAPVGSTVPLTFHDPFCYSLQAVVNGCPPAYPAYSPIYDDGSVYIEAAPVYEFTIEDNISAYPGQSDLEIPVFFDQSDGVSYFRFELQYDANALEFKYAEAGRFSIINAHTNFCGAGFLHVFCGPGSGDCTYPGSEPALYVHFKVKDLVDVGTLVPLTFHDPFCYSLQAVVNGCPPEYPAYSPTYDFGSVYVDHKGVRFTLPDQVQVYAGNNARMPVYVHNEEGLIYFRVDMEYDDGKLIYNGVEDARFSMTNVLECGTDPAHVSVFSTNSHCIMADPNYPGGVGFYINFQVKSGVPVGTIIPITFTDITCNQIQTLANGCEPEYSTFLPEWDHGSIKVKSRPSGCPFVYAWTGQHFDKDNTILTQSENPHRIELFATDYLALKKKPVLVDGAYRLQIREFEQEMSYLDNFELILVDHPERTQMAVSPEGKIRLYENQIAPLACADHNGVDQLEKIVERDGIFYTCDGPGHLILTLGAENPDDPLTVTTDVVIGPPPEPKEHYKAGSSWEPSEVKIEVEGENGNWIGLSDLPPRDDPSSQGFCFIGPEYFREDGTMKVRISWTNFYSADEIKYSAVSPEEPELHDSRPLSASHSVQGKVTGRLEVEDRDFVTLSPGEQVELAFTSPGDPAPGMVRDFVLKSSGYYVQLPKEQVSSHPTVCELYENYPNPFNMETVISYSLSRDANVELVIYNVLGEKVRTLVVERQAPGSKKVSWDGKDDKGQEVSSGYYFYRLKADGEAYTKKMLLLK